MHRPEGGEIPPPNRTLIIIIINAETFRLLNISVEKEQYFLTYKYVVSI